MPKSKFVETETHICNQIRYKVFEILTKVHSIEKIMGTLLKNNDSANVKKIVIQPRIRVGEDYTIYPGGVIEDDTMPWVKKKPWTEHNRID